MSSTSFPETFDFNLPGIFFVEALLSAARPNEDLAGLVESFGERRETGQIKAVVGFQLTELLKENGGPLGKFTLERAEATSHGMVNSDSWVDAFLACAQTHGAIAEAFAAECGSFMAEGGWSPKAVLEIVGDATIDRYPASFAVMKKLFPPSAPNGPADGPMHALRQSVAKGQTGP